MKTIINNIAVTLVTDTFISYSIGRDSFVGLSNSEKTLFVPFFGIDRYRRHGMSFDFLFDSDQTIHTAEQVRTWYDANDSMVSIRNAFNRRIETCEYTVALLTHLPGKTTVTNTELFDTVIKLALIRENRRVQWAGDDEQRGEEGTVMKIDHDEIQILWDAHKGAKLPYCQYPTGDPNIQSIA